MIGQPKEAVLDATVVPVAGKLFLLIWLIYAAMLGAIHVVTPPNPDSAIFDYMSWRVMAGDRLYVDVIEQNWPGAVWIHMLSTAVLGNTWWGFRLLDYLLLMLASAALFWMGSRGGARWTGWLAATLYPLMYVTSTPWMTGQRDALAAHLLVLGSALYVGTRGRWSGLWMVVLGLLCALTVMTRPTYLLFPALIVLFELVAHRVTSRSPLPFLKGMSYALLAFAASIALVAAMGARSGGLAGWWEAAIVYNLSVYSGSASAALVLQALIQTVQSWHWYLAFGFIGAVLWFRSGDRWAWLAIMALGLTCLVSFLVQGKAFGYHLAGVLPVLALFTARALAWALDTARGRKGALPVAIAVLMLAIALAGSARKLRAVVPQVEFLAGWQDAQHYLQKSEFSFEGISMADLMAVAERIRSSTSPEETVLVWSRGVWINFLSERRMPIPFATVGALAEFRDPSGKMAQQWLNALQQGLRCSAPVYIVLGADQGQALGESGHPPPSAKLAASDGILRTFLQEHYRKEAEVGAAQLWRRTAAHSDPCPPEQP
jgi:hypothetical protein